MDGASWFPFAVGVANNPDALTEMVGPGMDSTHHERPAGVACRFQVKENLVSPENSEAMDVLNDDPSGSDSSNNPGVLSPESAASAREPFRFRTRGMTDVLAGEPSANKVCCWGCQRADIRVARDSWPVLCEDGSAVGVDFAELDGSHSRSLKPKAEAPDAAEEVEDIHFPRLYPGFVWCDPRL